MSNLFIGIGIWIKGHIVATVVISTVVIGGAVATPIVINNMQESEPKVEEKQPIKEEVKQPDNEKIDSPIEEEQPVEDNKEPVKEDQKPNNTKPSTEKPTYDKSTETKPVNPQPEIKPTEPAGLSVSNHIVYYGGKQLISFDVYKVKNAIGRYFPTPIYNENEIKNLPADIKKQVPDYVCKALEGYQGCGYNAGTQRNEIYLYLHDWEYTKEAFDRQRDERRMYANGNNSCINYFKSQQYQDDLISESPSQDYTDCKVEYGYTLETYENLKAGQEIYIKYIDEDEVQWNMFKPKVKVFYKLFN